MRGGLWHGQVGDLFCLQAIDKTSKISPFFLRYLNSFGGEVGQVGDAVEVGGVGELGVVGEVW